MTASPSKESPSNPATLYIVVPAYNESSNIEALVDGWYPIVENIGGNSRLLVIDDGSTDDTYNNLMELSVNRPFLMVETKENGGHGPALLYGYRYALEHKADWVFQTDSDGQTLPKEFESFWAERSNYDAIFGMRPNRQDGIARKFVERTLCLILYVVFGVKIPDANAPFRLMRAANLERFLGLLPQDFNLPNAVITAYFLKSGCSCEFKEITFRPRQGGKNSINVRRIVSIGIKALGDFWRLRSKVQGV